MKVDQIPRTFLSKKIPRTLYILTYEAANAIKQHVGKGVFGRSHVSLNNYVGRNYILNLRWTTQEIL